MAPDPIIINDQYWVALRLGRDDIIITRKRDYTVYRPRNEGHAIASYYEDEKCLSFYENGENPILTPRIRYKIKEFFINQGCDIQKEEVV